MGNLARSAVAIGIIGQSRAQLSILISSLESTRNHLGFKQ